MCTFLHGWASDCIWQIEEYVLTLRCETCAPSPNSSFTHRRAKDTQLYMTTHPDPFPSALIRSNSTMLQLSIYSFLSLCLYDPLFLAQPSAVNWEVRKDLIAQRVLCSPPPLSLVILCFSPKCKVWTRCGKTKAWLMRVLTQHTCSYCSSLLTAPQMKARGSSCETVQSERERDGKQHYTPRSTLLMRSVWCSEKTWYNPFR